MKMELNELRKELDVRIDRIISLKGSLTSLENARDALERKDVVVTDYMFEVDSIIERIQNQVNQDLTFVETQLEVIREFDEEMAEEFDMWCCY